MTNTYRWEILRLDCYPESGNKTDVVFMIAWQRFADDGFDHVASKAGEQSIELDPNAPFTAFENLTFAQVVGWLEGALGSDKIAQIDAELDTIIQNQITPPVVVKRPPWGE